MRNKEIIKLINLKIKLKDKTDKDIFYEND